MFLIPAITMRMFSEEKRGGTLELLLTRPIRDIDIILGKYLAGVFLVAFSILPTILYYITISYLGESFRQYRHRSRNRLLFWPVPLGGLYLPQLAFFPHHSQKTR